MAAINSTSSVPIPTSNFANAIHSLLQYLKSRNSKLEKSKLFEGDDLIYLLLTLKTIPAKGRTNPYQIPIPKPFNEFKAGSISICLILDDTEKSSLQPEAARELIKSRNLPIDHVIGMWELKSDYKAYESRRKLCNSYDMFFADRRILPMLPSFIGKHFYKTKKLPLAVQFSRVGWPEQIRAACESTLMFMKTGTSVTLKIGRVGMSEEDILENALSVIEKAVEHIPKRWGGLRSLHVKARNTVALPIYQVVPEVGLKIEGVWDDEKKKLAEGKMKRERDGDGKKGRKAKKGRIGYVNDLVEADEGVVENGDSDEKVEEENNETNAKINKNKKRKMSVEKSEVPKKKKSSNDEKAVASEISKKKKGGKGVKIESEASNKKKGNGEKQLKKKVKKGEDKKKVEEVLDEPEEVEDETVENETSKKKGNGEKQLQKKVKKGEDKKKVEEVLDEPGEVAAETVENERSKKTGNSEKQLKKKMKKGEDKKKIEEALDEPEEVVCSTSVGKKKKTAKKIKLVKSKTAEKSG